MFHKIMFNLGLTQLCESVNFPDALLIDYMHLLCLGQFKTLFKIWFDSENSKDNFYLGKIIKVLSFVLFSNIELVLLGKLKTRKEIQDRIDSFKFPQNVNRVRFDIAHFKQWKASEFRVFFLYLSIPCLKNILPTIFYRNLCCLVFGM